VFAALRVNAFSKRDTFASIVFDGTSCRSDACKAVPIKPGLNDLFYMALNPESASAGANLFFRQLCNRFFQAW
jgi:hypothetical protein